MYSEIVHVHVLYLGSLAFEVCIFESGGGGQPSWGMVNEITRGMPAIVRTFMGVDASEVQRRPDSGGGTV